MVLQLGLALAACTAGGPPGTPSPSLRPPRGGEPAAGRASSPPPGSTDPAVAPDAGASGTGPAWRLSGEVLAPARILAENGVGLLSNNGSLLLGHHGVSVLGNDGNPLVSARGGSIFGKTKFYRLAQGRRLLAAEPQRPLTQALLYLTNRLEQFYRDSRGEVLATRVGPDGGYAFVSALPRGKEIIVNALLNDNLRLTGFVAPGAADVRENLTLGSTLATEFLRGDAYRRARSLAEYDLATFQAAASQTQAAIVSGELESVRTERDEAQQEFPVARFDLRADQGENLRNQYVISFSAAAAGAAALRGISDAWKALLGERPTAITTVMGSGGVPRVEASAFRAYGFAEGDTRAGETPRGPSIPLGYNYSVATAPVKNAYGGHDVFVGCATPAGNSGHIRWLRLDEAGMLRKVTSLWLPTYGVGQPLGLCVEKPPSAEAANPGSLLVADPGTNRVYRVFLVDEAIPGTTVDPAGTPLDHDRDPSTPPVLPSGETERYPMEIVAGEGEPAYATQEDPQASWVLDPRLGYLSQDHPLVVDGKAAQPYDPARPERSGWRFEEEGARRDARGTPFANPGRYARLDQPWDVTLDELGNIYIADKANHRIRFIPKVGGRNWFGYRSPILNDKREVTALSGAPLPMAAGALYTIAGSPSWDPARCPVGATGWFGAYGGDDGPAQLAKFDQPFALAWNDLDQCLYVADFDNQRIRKISRETGVVTTVVGSPEGAQRGNGQGDHDYAPAAGAADAGDGGPALQARLSYPRGLAFDARKRLYIADSGAGLVRMVDRDGRIHTVAGRFHAPNGSGSDNAGDGDARHHADLYDTEKIALDAFGNLLLQDYRHGRLRQVWRQWEQ